LGPYSRRLGFLGVVVSLLSCSGEVPEQASAVIRPAKLLEIVASSDIREANFPAIIEASDSAELTFQVGGLLEELTIREGQEVEAGAVIARLDQRNFSNELVAAQAQFEAAESEFQRAERLIAENAIARNIYEQRLAQRDVARAQLDSARKALDDSVLRSPFAGVISGIHTDSFQNVGPQEPIATVQTTGAAEAVVQIPARLVANSGRVEPLETVVLLDAAPEARIPATFYSSATQANPETQTFEVRFAFEPPEELIVLPGMTGTVQVSLEVGQINGSSDQITVPLGAILSDGDARYVWVVDEETMAVSRREVSLDAAIGETLPVLAGLEVGEVIVGAGAGYLHEGMQIRPYEP
jgi:RND family efflux transporter MFP subunit